MSRPTFGERWRGYGDRPAAACWTARASSLVGLVFGFAFLLVALTLLILLLAWMGLAAWRALFG